MRSLRLAVVFLTRVPIGVGHRTVPMARAVRWFPLVGAAVGAVVAGVYAVLEPHLGGPLSASIAVAAGIGVTGALHLDGLADTADAVAGGATPERRLEILDDSRLGTYGTAAVVIQILIQVLALAALGPAEAVPALVVAHALGRGAAVLLMALARPVRDNGLGVDYLRELTPVDVIIALVTAAASTILLGWGALLALPLAVLVVLIMRAMADRAFGGIGGDVLGATEQLVETAVLVVAVASI